MPKVFDAKFPSLCAECKQAICVGDPIFFPERFSKGVVHERCGQPVAKPLQMPVSVTVPPAPYERSAGINGSNLQAIICPGCGEHIVIQARVVK